MRKKLNLLDCNFEHHGPKASISCFPGYTFEPTKIEWNRVTTSGLEGDTVFTDGFLNRAQLVDRDKNIAWLIEPQALDSGLYRRFINQRQFRNFKTILTHDEELPGLIERLCREEGTPIPRIQSYFLGGCWTKPENFGFHRKTKDICIIASGKTQLPGHQMRHQIISQLAQKYGIDYFGRGYESFEDMGKVLKDYRICIVVENVKNGHWVTEKLITPLTVGCDVLYYGSEEVELQLNHFSSVNELEQKLKLIRQVGCKKYYEMRKEYLKEYAFEYAKEFVVCEDAIEW